MGFLFGGTSASAPAYNVEDEQKKAEESASKQNKKRISEQTDTIKTTALGASSQAATAKKTILGG